jgi:uncharacterized protein with PIN domain
MLPTIVIHPEERSFMTDIKTIEKDDLKNIEKLKPKELLIIPKKDFINWYEFTRNQVQEIEMKRKEMGSDFMECPNCRETMEDYYLKEPPEQELWHLCPHCNLTFSHNQYNRFTQIIMRAITSTKKIGGDL